MRYCVYFNYKDEDVLTPPREATVSAVSPRDAKMLVKYRQIKLGRKVVIHAATQIEGDMLYDKYRFRVRGA